ncbi:MAG: hypothetical protein ACPLUL_11965 [Thermanaerothrix sp.]|uniref:hypothetical protein n=1 Tax=Thermanaerothrix sp. TaxID=2972675 RepID=UPI003C7C02FD
MQQSTGASSTKEFLIFAAKVVLIHTATYFVFGLIMSNVFDYGRIFQQEVIRDYMRPMGSSAAYLGPLLQPLRGLLYAAALWPLRRTIMTHKRGWLILWGIFVIFGILGTPAAAPSSLEGIIYTKLPLWYHLIGLPEMLLQTLTFSLILVGWERRRYQPESSRRRSAQGADVIKAVMIACFAYMGYAIGSILSAVIARVAINFEAAASDWTTQIMFVVAFVFNVVFILLLSRLWTAHKITLWQVFLLFWVVDTVVPLGYQLIFLSPMPIPLAMLMGVFPALVITIGLRLGYKRE